VTEHTIKLHSEELSDPHQYYSGISQGRDMFVIISFGSNVFDMKYVF
jgi:hypothetical protein